MAVVTGREFFQCALQELATCFRLDARTQFHHPQLTLGFYALETGLPLTVPSAPACPDNLKTRRLLTMPEPNRVPDLQALLEPYNAGTAQADIQRACYLTDVLAFGVPPFDTNR